MAFEIFLLMPAVEGKNLLLEWSLEGSLKQETIKKNDGSLDQIRKKIGRNIPSKRWEKLPSGLYK
jgi:hypothetical protein